MWKSVFILHLLAALSGTVHARGFFEDVAKGVAVGVLVELFKSSIAAPAPPLAPAVSATPSPQTAAPLKLTREEVAIPRTITGSVDDTERVKAFVSALVDTTTPLEERIGYYHSRVDYFASGVVNHEFIKRDRTRFEQRWPLRHYRIVSIDEIEVDPEKKFAAARYTVEYDVKRPGGQASGITRYAVLLGTFDVQPRLYAIREWVQRNK